MPMPIPGRACRATQRFAGKRHERHAQGLFRSVTRVSQPSRRGKHCSTGPRGFLSFFINRPLTVNVRGRDILLPIQNQLTFGKESFCKKRTALNRSKHIESVSGNDANRRPLRLSNHVHPPPHLQQVPCHAVWCEQTTNQSSMHILPSVCPPRKHERPLISSLGPDEPGERLHPSRCCCLFVCFRIKLSFYCSARSPRHVRTAAARFSADGYRIKAEPICARPPLRLSLSPTAVAYSCRLQLLLTKRLLLTSEISHLLTAATA